MEQAYRSWTAGFANLARAGFWLLLIFVGLQQICAPGRLDSARAALIDRMQESRKSRVIAMIHREDTVSLFGVPLTSSIGIEDSEAILRAVRQTPPNRPIDLILHTPGGLVLAAEQIAMALADHKGKVTVFVPHYAMSGGTMIALTADEIVMDPHAVLGQVDPQIDGLPAASIVKLAELKKPQEIGDEMVVMIDMAAKSRAQVASFVAEVLLKHLPKEKAAQLATVLSEGRFTHDFPITVDSAKALGLPVTTAMPSQIYELMDLYPQGGASRPSVSYVPIRRQAPMTPTRQAGQAKPAPSSK